MVKDIFAKKTNILLLIAPALLLLGIFVGYPFIKIIIMSLQKTDGLTPATFVKFDQYKKIFADSAFWRANLASLWLCLLAVVFNAVLGVFIAVVLNGLSKKIQKFCRTSYIMPMVLSVSVISQLWLAIYHADWGILNAFLHLVGLDCWQNAWLSNPHTAMVCVAIVGMWWMFGMDFLMAYSGINNIPKQFYEAAELDGASKFQSAIHITIPLLKNVIKTCFIISATGGFFTFPQVYIMTGGGPGDLTQTIMIYMYRQAFSNQRYGRAAAVALISIIETCIILFVLQKAFKLIKSEE